MTRPVPTPDSAQALVAGFRAIADAMPPGMMLMAPNCAATITQARLRALCTLAEQGERDRRLYQELIYEVCNKTPNETRHESARRIIRQHESAQDNTPATALDATKESAG